MSVRPKFFIAGLCCWVPLVSMAASCKAIDDVGHLVQVNQPARRIISLAPDITEILFAIGANKQLAGVIGGSDYPTEAQQLPIVGTYSGIDLEKIVSLQPDLIVTWSNTFTRSLRSLKERGIPVYVTSPTQLEDVARTMKQLGCLAGTQQTANNAAEKYLSRLSSVRSATSISTKPITVFYQIGSYSLITINKQSWINQMITLCGGKNVFAEATLAAPEVSWEAVVAANPDVIISDADDVHWQDRWQRLTSIKAVKNHRFYTVRADDVERAGPRLLVGLERICQVLAK